MLHGKVSEDVKMNVDGYGYSPANYFENVRCSQSRANTGGQGNDPPALLKRAPLQTDSNGPAAKEKVALFAVWPEGNVGDQNQIVGITDAIKTALIDYGIASAEQITEKRLGVQDSPTETQAAALERLCKAWFDGLDGGSFDKLIVIGAGSGSNIAATLAALSGHPRVTTVFSGHQLTSNLATAARLPDITALPSGVMTPQQLASLEEKTELVLVAGVANQLTREKIAATVADYKAKGYPEIPDVDADTIAVILGGDAPDESGHQRLVTEENARSLARHIVAQEKPQPKTKFIVTNGPRTGKHAIDQDGKPLGTHRSAAPDPVTAAFVDELAKLTKAKIYLFNFQFGQLPSAYLPIIDRYLAAGEKAGHLYVPAESSSMVSETALLSKSRVISVTDATNPSHMNVVFEELSRTGGTVLHLDGKLEHVTQTVASKSKGAAFEIAKAVLERIWPKFFRSKEPSCPNRLP